MVERADAGGLGVAVDLRPSRTILATVRDQRVIDTRRIQHTGPVTPEEVADALAVLRERAPGPVTHVGVAWRPAEALRPEVCGPWQLWQDDLALRTGLPVSGLPAGAALARGEWLRKPVDGPLAVLALGPRVEGGVVVAGVPQQAESLDLGHLGGEPRGTPCPCGRRGCLDRNASELALQGLARDLEFPYAEPSSADWQTLLGSETATLERDFGALVQPLFAVAGHAVGRAVARLVMDWQVVEVRIRTRNPAQWQPLLPYALEAAHQALGPRMPRWAMADPGEDAVWVGAAACVDGGGGVCG